MPRLGGAQSAPTTLTLEQALQYALEHYPTVRAALEQVNTSTANVGVAKAASLPRFDSVWQTNRATADNIFGELLPQSVLPIDVRDRSCRRRLVRSVWGSAVGGLLSWKPVDFGLRGAMVSEAEAGVARARADEGLDAPGPCRMRSAARSSLVVSAQQALAAAVRRSASAARPRSAVAYPG